MKKLKLSIAMLFINIALLLVLAFGYCRGVYKFVKCDFSNETSWKPEIIYGLGTFSGLGCIIGWFDLGE